MTSKPKRDIPLAEVIADAIRSIAPKFIGTVGIYFVYITLKDFDLNTKETSTDKPSSSESSDDVSSFGKGS
jgi:hypothetical protein